MDSKMIMFVVAMVLCGGIVFADDRGPTMTLGGNSSGFTRSSTTINGMTIAPQRVDISENQRMVVQGNKVSISSKYGSTAAPVVLPFQGQQTQFVPTENAYIQTVLGKQWTFINSTVITVENKRINQVTVQELDGFGKPKETSCFFFDLSNWNL